MGSVDVSYLNRLLGAVGAAEDRAALLEAIGLSPDRSLTANERLPSAVVYELFDRLAERAGDPWFGLHLAEHSRVEMGALGVVRQACGNQANLGGALAELARLAVLVDDTNPFSLESRGADRVGAGFRPPAGGGLNAYANQFGLGMIYQTGRQVTGTEWAPLEVRLICAPRSNPEEASRIFGGAPIAFDCEQEELVLDRALLELPFVGADPALAGVLSRYATQLLDDLPETGLLQETRRAITELLARDATLPAVAEHLGTSPRTLQRRLSELGTSHQQLVDEIRQRLAVRYLESTDWSLSRVAFLLGYGDATAFARAFKRWYDQTPGQYRGR